MVELGYKRSSIFQISFEQCLKITEKVSFLRLYFECTKMIKNAKNGQFVKFLKTLKLTVKQYYQICHS